ncbi:MAG: hypothetical protein KF764_24695 [Labilithrix sp.]|nr:hypothetical protein [Labilithrix sp.]MBX3220444.1 hypothetical protein [Labilithrix sp.]
MSRLASAFAVTVVLGLAACRGAGPYGYAPNYVSTSDEESATKGAREYDPVMYQREPESWRKSQTVLFGVVTGRSPGPGGAAYLTLSVRRLEPRNLCSNANDEDTCRVTVSDRDFGVVHALAPLRPDDDVGEHSVGAGSLVRVSGQFGEDVDPNDGAPILRGSFYRHWPRHFFVTKANAETMRQ